MKTASNRQATAYLEHSPGLPLAEEPAPGDAQMPRTHIRPHSGWQALDVGELWGMRELLWIFTVRDVKVRYKQTFFGLGWAVVVPITQMVIFTVFFGHALGVSARVDAAAGRALPYPLFALAGQLVWNLYKGSIDGASTSLLVQANIVRKVYVPRLLLPLSGLGRPGVDAAVAFLLLIAVTAWYATGPDASIVVSPTILLAPLFLAGGAVAGLSIGLIVAALTVSYRDLQQVMPFFTSLLFFVTPVIYSVDLLPQRLGWLLYLNPVVGLLENHRAAIMGLPLDWPSLLASAAWTTVLLVCGLFYFARVERRFADVA